MGVRTANVQDGETVTDDRSKMHVAQAKFRSRHQIVGGFRR